MYFKTPFFILILNFKNTNLSFGFYLQYEYVCIKLSNSKVVVDW